MPKPVSAAPAPDLSAAVAQLAADVVEIKAYIAKDDARDTRLDAGLKFCMKILGGADTDEARDGLREIRKAFDHESHVAQLQADGKTADLKLYLAQHDAQVKSRQKPTDSPDKAKRRAELSAQMAALDSE